MTQLKRREEVTRVRRESIIDAAERVFFRKGYLNATVDEIVKEAEYSKRTVYVYMKSKAEMYDAVALRAYTMQTEYLLATKVERDAVKELVAAVQSAMNFVKEQPGYTAIITNYHLRATDPSCDVPKEIIDMDARLLGILEEIVERGVAEGSFRKELNIKFTATYLATVFLGVVDMVSNKTIYLQRDRGLTAEVFIKNATDMLLHSLKKY
ncbi:MAG: TetR/AcrR family transcriptional regulator; helix-turn-helix transcriptional regulator [Deferribacteraceae bacterium]|jgi:AcrR family transcriptional regulator|nr:TetR/AcrR family transcriptional regulator; helix-turn-helix transcriptional regulator [Deferribacteraceae bacterium]